MTRKPAYGSCGYCGRWLSLRGDGTIRRHRPGRGGTFCPGSLLSKDAGEALRRVHTVAQYPLAGAARKVVD